MAMTLMDETCADRTSQDPLLSHSAHRERPPVSVVVPVHPLSDAAATLERLPRLDCELIVVAPRAPHTAEAADRATLRAGFRAARGDCIVVLDQGAEVDAHDIDRFVAALSAGCRSVEARAS
jgi:hypothetical protein